MLKSVIENVHALEIFDSRGNPTVEVPNVDTSNTVINITNNPKTTQRRAITHTRGVSTTNAIKFLMNQKANAYGMPYASGIKTNPSKNLPQYILSPSIMPSPLKCRYFTLTRNSNTQNKFHKTYRSEEPHV